MLVSRHLARLLSKEEARQLILITGARQTGKTTLARNQYPDLPYFNLDAMENRQFLSQISSLHFGKEIGVSIIDEAQKEPSVFEKLKYAYDDKQIAFSVLLGSSQILLLKKIRESLAGRISIYELFPLMMSELASRDVAADLQLPMIEQLFEAKDLNDFLSSQSSLISPDKMQLKRAAQHHLMQWGGMPALLHIAESDRQKWIRDYEYTYLERDLADLARLHDLEPFRLFQQLAALRSAHLLNYSELARDSGVSVDTARRYLEYLRLSYQVELLRPYRSNLGSSLVKTPKIYWLDIGLYRSLTQYYGQLQGQLYETLVVSEVVKWKRSLQKQVELYFYRTQSGLEVDLLLKKTNGIIGLEIKSRSEVSKRDCKNIQSMAEHLKDEWLGGMVVYNGDRLVKIAEPNIWAMPSSRLFT
jgi:predicted AAA+ superfamily ATPase